MLIVTIDMYRNICHMSFRISIPAIPINDIPGSCRCTLHGAFMATVTTTVVTAWGALWNCKGRLLVVYILDARVETAWSCGGSVDFLP